MGTEQENKSARAEKAKREKANKLVMALKRKGINCSIQKNEIIIFTEQDGSIGIKVDINFFDVIRFKANIRKWRLFTGNISKFVRWLELLLEFMKNKREQNLTRSDDGTVK